MSFILTPRRPDSLSVEHDNPYDCSACGREGRESDANDRDAFCNDCELVAPIEEPVCPHCGHDALIHACPDCSGPWRRTPPNDEDNYFQRLHDSDKGIAERERGWDRGDRDADS